MAAAALPPSEFISIPPQNEVRFILAKGQEISVSVTSGFAYLFGWHARTGSEFKFKDESFAIYCQQPCIISVSGTFQSYYCVPCPFFSNYDRIRSSFIGIQQAKPVILVTGGPSSGKTTFCKWVLNLINADQKRIAESSRAYPIFVNADPNQALFSPPGCVSAMSIVEPIRPSGFQYSDPLAYFYGHDDISEERLPLFVELLRELSVHVKGRRFGTSSSDGGVIIDFPYPRNQTIYAALEATIEAFGVTHIICIGDDSIQKKLKHSFPSISIEKLPKVPGASVKDRETVRYLRNAMTERYFYGDISKELNPANHQFMKGQLQLYCLGAIPVRQASIEAVDPKKAQLFPISPSMNANIIAVIPNCAMSEIWKQNALGFLKVLSVDAADGSVQVNKPNQFDVPQAMFVIGSVKASAD